MNRLAPRLAIQLRKREARSDIPDHSPIPRGRSGPTPLHPVARLRSALELVLAIALHQLLLLRPRGRPTRCPSGSMAGHAGQDHLQPCLSVPAKPAYAGQTPPRGSPALHYDGSTRTPVAARAAPHCALRSSAQTALPRSTATPTPGHAQLSIRVEAVPMDACRSESAGAHYHLEADGG